MNHMLKSKEIVQAVVVQILKGIGMAVLCLLLVWGLREQVHVAIDKCLVPMFGFKGNWAMSLFFLVLINLFHRNI